MGNKLGNIFGCHLPGNKRTAQPKPVQPSRAEPSKQIKQRALIGGPRKRGERGNRAAPPGGTCLDLILLPKRRIRLQLKIEKLNAKATAQMAGGSESGDLDLGTKLKGYRRQMKTNAFSFSSN